ncbi:MAG: T9SS type A sorting domain-containing protein [Williamsia sp.]|nr:T9SS type A sorting domain-containing protein [Williamsia sp.]
MRFSFGIQIANLILSAFFFILLAPAAKAQFRQTLFYDTVSKASGEGYIESGFVEGKYMYVSGASFSDRYPLPTVIKTDTAGNAVWTATDNDNYSTFGGIADFAVSYTPAVCKGTLKSANRIYTIAGRDARSYQQKTHYEVWCLSDSTGVLLWKVSLDNRVIVKLADYSSTELLAVTGGDNYCYVLDKVTGAIVRKVGYGSGSDKADILIDSNRNILLSAGNFCRKYRDSKFGTPLWISSRDYYGSYSSIDKITQQGNRYIFMGRDNVRSVDTLTGSTVWFRDVPVGNVVGIQGGSEGDPQDYILRDSLLYVIWWSPYVGGVDLQKGFTLTCLNTQDGSIRFNVAYDFTGVPADVNPDIPFNDALDWPVAMCMDNNRQIYMTGAYDSEHTGNWGIMKLDGRTGAKIYEATITADSTKRTRWASGKFIRYQNGRLYCGGNLQNSGVLPPTMGTFVNPAIVSFDTGSVYKEQYRVRPSYTIRYSSALIALAPAGQGKMVLLKKTGRSGVIEMRTSSNRLLWSRTFSAADRFVVPQTLAILSDTAIAASFLTYREDTITHVLPGARDSILMVSLDTNGNTRFRKSLLYKTSNDLTPLPTYTDVTGRVNFLFRSTANQKFAYKGYMLNGKADSLDYVSTYIEVEPYDYDHPALRVMPVQHYNGDTMVVYQANLFNTSNGWLHSATQQDTGYTGYKFYGFRNLYHFDKTYSALKTGSTSYFVMGRDDNGHIKGELYNYSVPGYVVWSYNPAVLGTMYNADTSATSLYTLSKNNANELLITKLNRATGEVNWQFKKSPGVYTTSILPVDFRYDAVHRYFLVGGYISDATIPNNGVSYFHLVLDSAGKVVSDDKIAGFSQYDTKISSTNVLGNGTHLYGGTISTEAWGTAGFYNSMCFGNNLVPSVSISSSDSVLCKGTAVTFTASPAQEGDSPVYQWTVNGVNAGTNSPLFTTSALSNNDKVKVKLSSNADCLQTPVAESNEIAVQVSALPIPTVSIAGNVTVEERQSATITATISQAGSGTDINWQDSTHTHNWQAIAGAAGASISYKPTMTGDAIRCVLRSQSLCGTSAPVMSDPLSFVIEKTENGPGVISYPNPTRGSFTIDSLSLNDNWQTLEVVSVSGNQRVLFKNIENSTKIIIPVAQLPKGVYVAILRRADGAPEYIKFLKL